MSDLSAQRKAHLRVEMEDARTINRLSARVALLEKTLAHAVEQIRAWHAMPPRIVDLSEDAERQAWEIYYNHAPEMEQIRSVLGVIGAIPVEIPNRDGDPDAVPV